MKQLIINETNLTNEQIGNIIDAVIKLCDGTTHYYGQIECCTAGEIHVQIRYLKSYVEFRFWKGDK